VAYRAQPLWVRWWAMRRPVQKSPAQKLEERLWEQKWREPLWAPVSPEQQCPATARHHIP
jgi:hypothetical protein